ncbi:MAG: GNAT family N-acetyltransferase [Thermoplasmata archaeon]|nr:MAG: GNAT family N-acetyltransferase [Thermoplasmata archaeon]
MEIVRANSENIIEVLELVQECMQHMNDQGIEQWNEQYPQSDIFISDIEKDSLFIIKNEENIVGIIVLSEEQDEQYDQIDWKDKFGKVLLVHRLAVHPKWQGKGIAQKLMDFGENYAKENGYSSIRLDTYSQNPRSLKLFEKRKYERKSGHIHFPECKEPYYCYEMLLKDK